MCRCRTPAPLVPTTPASLSRYCLVDVDSFPSPFSGELFGSSFVSLDPLPPPAPSCSAATTLTPYQLSAAAAPSTVVESCGQPDSRLLTLATTGLSPRATTTAAAAQMTATSNTDDEVSSSCVSGLLVGDHQQPQYGEPDIGRCDTRNRLYHWTDNETRTMGGLIKKIRHCF